MQKKKGFFRKLLSKFWASSNSDLQIKRSLQNKTTDHNNYTNIKKYSFNADLLIRDIHLL